MKRKSPFFHEVYAVDHTNQAYMIEVRLAAYTNIFSEWDPAPFKRRELDPDLRLYLEESADEIPRKYPIELVFTLPATQRDPAMETEICTGIQNSLQFKLYLLKKAVGRVNTRTLRYVIAGLGTLWIARLLDQPAAAYMVTSVLTEGLFIGGWVFLWEAVSLFFFTNRDLYCRYRMYQRLLKAPILFQDVPASPQ